MEYGTCGARDGRNSSECQVDSWSAGTDSATSGRMAEAVAPWPAHGNVSRSERVSVAWKCHAKQVVAQRGDRRRRKSRGSRIAEAEGRIEDGVRC